MQNKMEQINKKELHTIFRKLQNKDEQAFNDLYKNYYNLVKKIAYSVLKNEEESQDIAQNVFTKIYNMQDKNLPVASESSWLYTVTKNEAITYLKKQKNTIDLQSIYDISSEDEQINNIIEREKYNKLIQGLKPIQKEIVSLKILSQLNFRQISYVLNMPISTVQWHYYKAIKSLKVLISNLGLLLVTLLLYAKNIILKTNNKTNEELQENTQDSLNDNTLQNNQNEIISGDTIESENKEDYSNSYTSTTQTEESKNDAKVENNTTEADNNTTLVQDQDPITLKSQNTIWLTLSAVFLLLAIFITIIFTKYQQKTYRKKS